MLLKIAFHKNPKKEWISSLYIDIFFSSESLVLNRECRPYESSQIVVVHTTDEVYLI